MSTLLVIPALVIETFVMVKWVLPAVARRNQQRADDIRLRHGLNTGSEPHP